MSVVRLSFLYAVDPWERDELQKLNLVKPPRSKVVIFVEVVICALMICALVVFFVYTFSYTPKLVLYNRYVFLLCAWAAGLLLPCKQRMPAYTKHHLGTLGFVLEPH